MQVPDEVLKNVSESGVKTPEEYLASKFHETYERLSFDFNYVTRRASAVPWDEVPQTNKKLMVAVAKELIDSGIIKILH